MQPSRRELEADSWAFALAIYARPGVADSCLTLQNQAGVDVTLLLMVTFAAVNHRILLTADEIKTLNDDCAPWREQVVRRLRAIRSDLKTGPMPAPSDETESLRAKVKALELEAERLQNHLMTAHLPIRPPGGQIVRPDQLRAALNNVVAFFADQRGSKPNSNLSSSIDVIVEAAMQDAS
jgi:uncharacterized protein (TIGR02444 family)